MSLQQYYESFSRLLVPESCHCLCGGSGWALSDVDTWHQCPFHYQGNQPHPEDDTANQAMAAGKPYRGDDGHLYVRVYAEGGEEFYRLHEDPQPAPAPKPDDGIPF